MMCKYDFMMERRLPEVLEIHTVVRYTTKNA